MKMLLLIIMIALINSQPTNSDSCVKWNNNAGICEQCLEGFLLEYFFCIPCNRLCTCSSDQDYCDTCIHIEKGHFEIQPYLKDNVCYLCSQSITNCISCQNQNKCLKCINGKYLVDLNQVSTICSNATCDPLCEICQDENFCQVCIPGYFLQNDGKCHDKVCTSNCTICQTKTSCRVCDPYHYEINGQCVQCMQNCFTCSNQTNCQLCDGGYNFIDGSCVVNSNGLNNCIRYAADFSVCLECQPGYYISQGACSQCSGCSLCNAQFICLTQCFTGFKRFNFACLPAFQDKIKFLFMMLLLLFMIY